MRVHVVSDVHGRADALARSAEGADALICLGDLLLFLDYADHGQGIFADLFEHGVAAGKYVQLRTAKKLDEAREFSLNLLAKGGPESRASLFEAAMTRQYAELLALSEPAYLTYGNVDVPGMWERFTKPGHRVLDGGTAELDGWTFGFVGGGLRSVYRTPNEMSRKGTAPRSRRSVRRRAVHAHPARRPRTSLRHRGPAYRKGQRGAARRD